MWRDIWSNKGGAVAYSLFLIGWIAGAIACGFARCYLAIRYPGRELGVGLLGFAVKRLGRSAQGHFSFPMAAGEIACALLAATAYRKWGLEVDFLFHFYFIVLIVVLALIDAYAKILPNLLTLAGLVAGVLFSFFREGFGPLDAFLGALTPTFFLLSVAALHRLLRRSEGVGMGDVKLMAFAGSYLGWQGSLMAIMGGSLLAAAAGILYIAARRRPEGLGYEIPFGPFLGIGAIMLLFVLG